ncbi:hypothetical protein NKR23_g7942 [Pleurostoma richardsiae]|uniref:Translation initiation factor 3 C-terminal domain-containing protein n=1 Tax=Pleurostoma richardsiae TaxID=41990 RepID=A0AA38RAI3_9PEZI|nr:hypothetical protein NKR23_g7942 [Pleurostoma richardsiae]
MRGPTCLFSAGAALRRVFMSSSLEYTTAHPPLTKLFLPSIASAHQIRSASFVRRVSPGAGPRGPYHGGKPRGGGDEQRRPSYKLNRLPRDQEITHRYVHVAGAGEDGKLSEPMPTREVLQGLNLATHSLVVVALPAGDKGPRYPVCKVVDKKAATAAGAEKAKAAARRKGPATKELELNWAIAPHDLEHRLKQMRTFLGKGLRVQVLLLNKARKRRASDEEAREVLAKVKETAAEVAGTKEWKAPEGAIRGSMKLFLEGPQSQSQSQSRSTPEPELQPQSE